MGARSFVGQAGGAENGEGAAFDVHASGSSVPTRLRLTRRGRLVVTGLVALGLAGVLVFAAALLSPEAFASTAASGDKQFHYVVAQSGDSLWSLASELDPQADPRDLIAEIVQLNQLEGSDLEAGQAIAVPLRYSSTENTVSS